VAHLRIEVTNNLEIGAANNIIIENKRKRKIALKIIII